MRYLMKTAAFAAFGLFTLPAWGIPVHPYGVDGSDVFSMSTVGLNSGGGISEFSGDNTVFSVPENTQINIGNGAQSTSASLLGLPGTSGNAHATASFGLIRHYAAANSAAYDGSSHAGAISDAGWLDTLTISNPSLTGQAGQMTFGVSTDGSLDASNNAAAGWTLSMQATSILNNQSVKASLACYLGPCFDKNDAPATQVNVAAIQLFTVDFTFGTPFEMLLRSLISAGLRSTGGFFPDNLTASTAIADFDNTIFWDGIYGVTQGGVAVDFQISALSGTDWTQSFDPNTVQPAAGVPEPITLSLLGAGFAGLGWARRRQ